MKNTRSVRVDRAMLPALLAGIVAAALVLSPVSVVQADDRARDIPTAAQGPYAVLSVVDGDTLWLRIGSTRAKVRLIGIDTPETVDPRKPIGCFGPEASARAKELLSGQRVFVEYDKSQGRHDRYGRTLGYVWLPDGQLFNEVMIAGGFGREYTYRKPYAHQPAFKRAEAVARATGAGLWGACPR